MTSLTSCLSFLSFVFTDQIYLTETNAAKCLVLIMHWKLQPHLMFSSLLRKRIIVSLECSFRSSSPSNLEGSHDTQGRLIGM